MTNDRTTKWVLGAAILGFLTAVISAVPPLVSLLPARGTEEGPVAAGGASIPSVEDSSDGYDDAGFLMPNSELTFATDLLKSGSVIEVCDGVKARLILQVPSDAVLQRDGSNEEAEITLGAAPKVVFESCLVELAYLDRPPHAGDYVAKLLVTPLEQQ